jgi:CubicO group peptidase (beta-lactamase class C family)
VAQVAAARALLGESPISGTLPIAIPPDHPVGSGISRGGETTVSSNKSAAPAGAAVARPDPAPAGLPLASPREVGMDPIGLARLDGILEDAVRTRAIPGAALAVGRHGKLVRLQGYGRLDPRPGFGMVTDSSIYDLASLTKVIGTTTAVMLLVEAGQLDLDAPLARYLPEWRGSAVKEEVTVHQLLTHSAGLPAFGPLWKEHRGREAYLQQIAGLDLEYQPGTKEVYSDYGMILLGLMIERIAGRPLDLFLAERVFEPLGMRETGFNPTALARIAPTEIDTLFRKTHIHGEVHDENAYAIGGVAGHAGLFSSARDLARFAQLLLDGGAYGTTPDGAPGGSRLLRAETIRDFATRQPGRTSRAIGWDTPSGNSSAGEYFSAGSFGHTGFTGTSIWIDPERDVFVVLLTNRVNPSRANQRHIALRRAVHDAVQQAITDVPVSRR